MRRLIVSDIHGNLDALEAVMQDASGEYDEIICCGDLVGYCANPREVIAWARSTVAMIVRGNHDRVCSTLEGVEEFNPVARAAAEWTHGYLNQEELAWLSALPQGPLLHEDFALAHGSPGDEDEYVFYSSQVEELTPYMGRRVCFVGHTHIQGGWSWERDGVSPLRRPAAIEREILLDLNSHGMYLLNPGSVGQPRDGDVRAGYALWDDRGLAVCFRRVGYDVRRAQDRMLAAGLPAYLASRLGLGR